MSRDKPGLSRDNPACPARQRGGEPGQTGTPPYKGVPLSRPAAPASVVVKVIGNSRTPERRTVLEWCGGSVRADRVAGGVEPQRFSPSQKIRNRNPCCMIPETPHFQKLHSFQKG